MSDEYDLAGKVIGFAMKVHRALGPGFLENVYQRVLQFELLRAGFRAEVQVPVQVRYEGVVVGDYVVDLLVNEELVVEMKAVTSLIPAHEVQTVNYLAATGKDEGLLLNFGAKSLEFKRKFRTCHKTNDEGWSFRENSVNSVNSV